MSEDNVLSSFNFLDEEDDDSDEEGDRWEDETSSASQLTKVVHVQSHTHTHTHSPRYGEDTCTYALACTRSYIGRIYLRALLCEMCSSAASC